MMIYAVPYHEKSNHLGLFDDMFRERHRLYVEGRGWKELGKVDGREIDQFDTPSTIYLLSVNSYGELLGGIRLNPSTQPHLLDTVFPELCVVRSVPKSVDTWEMSRLFVCHHKEFDESGESIKGALFCAMYEFCLLHNIKTVSAVCDSYFLPRVLKAGVTAVPLGLPKAYESGEMMGVEIEILREDLDQVRAHYKVSPNALATDLSLPKAAASRNSQIPRRNDGIEEIKEISEEIELLRDMGVMDQREEFIIEFSDLIPRLASANKAVASKAEKELDSLTEKVRRKLFGVHDERNNITSRLQ